MRTSYVYMLASRSRALYIGVTRNLHKRVAQHRTSTTGHTARYRITRLVWYEQFHDIRYAIEREKQLKGWTRARKIALVDAFNPAWDDFLGE